MTIRQASHFAFCTQYLRLERCATGSTFAGTEKFSRKNVPEEKKIVENRDERKEGENGKQHDSCVYKIKSVNESKPLNFNIKEEENTDLHIGKQSCESKEQREINKRRVKINRRDPYEMEDYTVNDRKDDAEEIIYRIFAYTPACLEKQHNEIVIVKGKRKPKKAFNNGFGRNKNERDYPPNFSLDYQFRIKPQVAVERMCGIHYPCKENNKLPDDNVEHQISDAETGMLI